MLRLLPLVLLAAAASAQPADVRAERAARLDSALSALHADGLFDGALAISDADGTVVYRFAAGTYEGAPVTTRTPYPLASVTKAMTAATVLSLASSELLDLDAPVGEYLDPWPYPEVTVRHLIDQTAGLHFLTALTAHADTTRPVTTADLLAVVAEHRPGLVHAPGTAFDYDNANYETAAAVIEAASGQPYAEAVRQRVIEPAGMTDATTDGTGEIAWAAWAGGGGDAVRASAEDLLAFDDAFWAGRVVPDSLVAAALRPPVLADGSASRYVFGRFVETDPRPLVGHFGDGDAKTGLYREREGGTSPGTTYALVMSPPGIHRTAVMTAVMAIWNGEPFVLPQARPVADVPEAVLARHVGSYSSGFGLLHVTLEDGQLHLEPEGAGGSEPLVPASETVFYFGGQDLTWEFVTDEDGRTVGLQLQGNPETYGERVDE
jgi:CubicO group peptidase (beta-lactamase class C family)